MSKFNAVHCRAGHKVISRIIDESSHNRATGEEIAEQLNIELKLDPESREAWNVDDVKCAVYEGAFDSKTRHFGYYRGRYGGYREYDIECAAASAEEERVNEKKSRKRRSKKETQPEVQTLDVATEESTLVSEVVNPEVVNPEVAVEVTPSVAAE